MLLKSCEKSEAEPVSEQNLRAAVLHRATESRKQILRIDKSSSAKINEFDGEVFVDDHVFVFDVTMNDAQRIQV